MTSNDSITPDSYADSNPTTTKDQSQNSFESTVRGVIMRVTYRNQENNYSVVQCSVKDEREAVTMVGYCLNFSVGTEIIAEGRFIEHKKFGRQFSAEVVTEVEPSSLEGIRKYLSSGLIKGIGDKTVERIVNEHGTDTLEVICCRPEEIAAIPGVGTHKAQLLSDGLRARRDKMEIEKFLIEHNVGNRLTQRIFEKYGQHSISIVKKNPYQLANDLRGVGFATADALALSLGFSPDSPHRLKAGVYYALEKAAEKGHCFLPAAALSEQVQILLGLDQQYDLSDVVSELVAEEFIVVEDDNIYMRNLYEAETFVARDISYRYLSSEGTVIDDQTTDQFIAQSESQLGISFSGEQIEAVKLSLANSFALITGGPGCGKTTIIRALAHSFIQSNLNLALAAPTGKAAQRMAQVCQLPAQTVHRLLKFDPRTGQFEHGINNPIKDEDGREFQAIIVDEASMLDIVLAKDLLSAIPPGCHLVFVGDKDQLPSVGPGTVFSDLINSTWVPKVCLSKLFRRDSHSLINSIAFAINAGISPDIPVPDGQTKTDAYFIEKRDANEAAQLIEQLFAEQIPRKFNVATEDITVLTPSNRGVLGTSELNLRIQSRLQHKNDQPPLDHYDRKFYIGDRVCQRKNNYKLGGCGVFNGDIGTVYSINYQDHAITVELWDGRLVEYSSSDLAQLSLAYTMTIHRSQGSEIPCVLMALHESQFTLLERQLFYTGVTRAKKLLVVVGSKKALAIAAKRLSTARRQGNLLSRLDNLYEQGLR